ncbi:MAG TPA: Si-specific NAD(P)(+) transhydrogenase [Tepidisphaeraceae bacterium]|nr:Si-specific NAD(P)(+) transhydrogenase [Tepidisphaeraceae bacterium]
MRHFDCVVIGSGPGGQKAAIQAAKIGKHVCIIEKSNVLGGTSINTGTIPSKALREAVLHLTGLNKRSLFGESYRVKRSITIADLTYVSQQVVHSELELIRDQLERNGVELIWGSARFDQENVIFVDRPDDFEVVSGDFIVIATGTRPARPDTVPFDNKTIFTSDELLKLDHIPKTMIVVGGGVIGIEYACMLAALGVKITLVEGRHEVLGFLDDEITEALQYQMRRMGVTLRLGEKVHKIEQQPANGTNGAEGPTAQATLESGKTLHAQTLLYSVGRQGTTTALAVERAGLKADDRERLKVNANYQTEVPHIYAVGDVIGFPALASTAMEQGRLAVCHAFGAPTRSIPELFPFGIYAIPEISMVGRTEDQLTTAGIPYEAGIAQYRELARGQLLGDTDGMLKLLIHQENRLILGVHAIGTGATELIHIGQAVMALQGTLDYFVNSVFNYPTLAEAYKVAALNGMNKLQNT